MNNEYATLIAKCSDLSELHEIIYKIKTRYFPQDDLHPVPGGGKTSRPEIMGILINPTERNISSHTEWSGPRFPFVGIKSFWRVFYKAGILDESIMRAIEGSNSWTYKLATDVMEAMIKRGVYLTNLVKRTYHSPRLPDLEMVNIFLPVLLKEIDLVRPMYIVTFGSFTLFHLTRLKLKLSEYYQSIHQTGSFEAFSVSIHSRSYTVIPCYFPVGRGNPTRATKILEMLWGSLQPSEKTTL
jgi:uracil-DNA glycosylase